MALIAALAAALSGVGPVAAPASDPAPTLAASPVIDPGLVGEAKKPAARKKTVTKHTSTNVHLRAKAGTKHKSLQVIGKGTSLTVLKTSGGWSQVKVGKKTGWVSTKNLTTKAPAVKKKAPAPVKKAPQPAKVSFGFVQKSGIVAAGNTAPLWIQVKNSNSRDRYFLEKKVSGQWVKTSSAHSMSGNTHAIYTVKKGKNTSDDYRYVREVSGKAVGRTGALKVRFGGSSKALVPTYPVMDGITQSTGRVVIGETVTVKVKLTSTGTNRTGRIEVNTKGKWKKVATLKMKNQSADTTGTGIIPKSSVHGKSNYRVIIDAKAGSRQLINGLKVDHVNPSKYTGIKKKSHQWMKKWCSNVVIDTHSNTRTSYAYSNPERISMSTKLDYNWSGAKFVAYHECAHIMQYRAYTGRLGDLSRDAKKLHGSNGVEHQADCMSSVMGMPPITRKYTSGYNTKCSKTQLEAAKKIVSGKPITKK